jgi:O-antigen ligase
LSAAAPGPRARTAASLLVALALAGAVIEPRLGGIGFYLLALFGLGLALRSPARAAAAWRSMPELCAAALLLVGLNLASVLAFDLRARAFSWTPLLAVPLAALVANRGLVTPRAIYAGGALGAACALGAAAVDWFVHGQPRPSGRLNAIVFGQLALICAVYALAGLLRDPGRWRSIAYLAGVGAGVAATVASGTRGAMLALPLLGALAWRSSPVASAFEVTHRRALVAIVVAMLLLAGAFGQRLELWDRMARIDDEVAAYQEGTVGTRAVALRLALWTAALEVAAEHPLFGVGAHGFKPAVERLQAQGRYPADAVVYSHAHNLPLSVLAEYGVVGLTVLVLAGWLAWQGLARSPPDLRRLGRVGLAAWFVLGMTNDVFAHQNTLRVLALGLALCAALRTPAEEPAPGRGLRPA